LTYVIIRIILKEEEIKEKNHAAFTTGNDKAFKAGRVEIRSHLGGKML
jgi:hypothetical protein